MRSGFYCFLLFFGGTGGDDMGDFWLYEMELLICPSDAVLKENSHYQTSLHSSTSSLCFIFSQTNELK